MKRRIRLISLVMLLVILTGGNVVAETSIFTFDEKILYDIYLGGDNPAVIRSVNIVRQMVINGRNFLVIKPSGFSLSENVGYIGFDAVQALLPATYYRVDGVSGFGLFQK